MDFNRQIQQFVPGCAQEEADQRAILAYIRLCPDTVLCRSNAIAHITSSGLVVNHSLSRVLLVHHNIYNTWAWTGGHADGDHNLLGVALREAEEETGLTQIRPLTSSLLSLDILPVQSHLRRGEYVGAHLHLSAAFVLLADEKHHLRHRPQENSAVSWFAVEELAERSGEPHLVRIYQKLLKRAGAFCA